MQAESGDLDPALAPDQRVTPPNMDRFLKALKAAGNKNSTITQRLWDLRTALGIMMPGVDFAWVTSPGGVDVRSLLPAQRRSIEVYHPKQLFDWGLHLTKATPTTATPRQLAISSRNGLAIMILAARAPRLRSLASLRLGSSIRRLGEEWFIALDGKDTKTGKWLEYRLPATLTPAIDAYVQVHRPALLRGADHDWFWVNGNGGRFGERGIEGMIRRATQACFGAAFGPHRFRHCLATVADLADPLNPGAGAAILGSSPAVVKKHYNRGRTVIAAQGLHDAIAKERAALRASRAPAASIA